MTRNVKNIYTNIQGMWNRLVHRSEKRRLCVTNKIVRMGVLIVLGEFSLIKVIHCKQSNDTLFFLKFVRKFSYLQREFSLLLMFSKALEVHDWFLFFVGF